ncbi:MAG: DNA polymerase III subunit epsilon [Proteobacteria bacterium]|nr:DNA polymerase III subunit epsilon [SAR86 cluster bacterium]MDA0345753.1 DNA polymerase III subunit epsilon [Pseudomonadota bacterium]MDA0899541.1 DNA polymerase III subunit epsilon [Pseudomonadota bacterium]
MSARIVTFDTETTGLDYKSGDRVIEIGLVEILGREKSKKTFQTYLNPEGKEISEGAKAITNISASDLVDAPKFAEVVDDFIDFIKGAEVVIHNAEFDVGFINNELKIIGHSIKDIRDICTVFDTLIHARKVYPGQKNSLDALSNRLDIIGYDRQFHGALLDAQILADVYLNLTGGQVKLELSSAHKEVENKISTDIDIKFNVKKFTAQEGDLSSHQKILSAMSQKSGEKINW